ncbi:cyclophilin-like fold protein [Paenibacillus sp. FSL H7-0703]
MGNLAIFYQDFGYSSGLVKLGHIEVGVEKLVKMNGSFTMTIEQAQ